VPDYRGLYEVSNFGKIRSLSRVVPDKRIGYKRLSGTLLSQSICVSGGYPVVSLCKFGISKKLKVHRIVARAFIGKPPCGNEVCHNDGNPLNSSLSNLRYDTPIANIADKKKHGTHLSGETHHYSKLTDANYFEIAGMCASGCYTYSEIAKMFGVSVSCISGILNGYSRRARDLGVSKKA